MQNIWERENGDKARSGSSLGLPEGMLGLSEKKGAIRAGIRQGSCVVALAVGRGGGSVDENQRDWVGSVESTSSKERGGELLFHRRIKT